MLLRMALIALIALALARPWVSGGMFTNLVSTQSRDVVFVIGTFAIANWDRKQPYGDDEGTVARDCGQAGGVGYACGMVWGYFMEGAVPPDSLVGRFGDSNNPFAPIAFALVE